MSTYIKGVTDITPDSIPFQANYKLISNTLSNLQARYEKGYSQVKSMYNSLMNDPLSSSDNEQFRQEYLKKADSQLSKLSGVDFANYSNVVKAKSLFGPLVNDEQYVMDLYKTKRQNAEIQRMQSVKNSFDKDTRNQYNPIMEQYLMIGKERLSQTKRDDGSIEAASVHQFSPWEDPVDFASAKAKEQGLKFERDTLTGMYIVHTLNGEQSLGTYKNWYLNTIGNRFDNQFRIEAEVNNYNAVKGMMQKDPNLTEDAAMKQLAQNFSEDYLDVYKGKIDDLESRGSELDRQMKTLQRKQPGKFDARYKDQVDAIVKEKNYILETLSDLRKELANPTEFKDKASNLFLNNPSVAYIDRIKNDYANRFAQKQAYGQTEVSYKANEVELTKYKEQQEWGRLNARLSQEWKIFEAGKKYDALKMQAQFEHDFQMEMLKGTIKGTNQFATQGNMEDVGVISTSTQYRETISDAYQKGYDIFKNEKYLAVAAGIFPDGNTLKQDSKNAIQFNIVSNAILHKQMGTTLSAAEESELGKYLKTIAPSYTYNPKKDDFAFISGLINKGFKFYKDKAGDLGQSLADAYTESRQSMENYANLYATEQKNLEAFYVNNKEYRDEKYIVKQGNNYYINYDVLDKLKPADKEPVYKNLIVGYDKYLNKTAKQRNTIVLNPSDVDKFDQTIHANVINNAEKIGVTNKDGKFENFDDDDISEVRALLKGGDMMKKILDPVNTTYAYKIENGIPYVKVTIPVKKTEKGESTADVYDLPNAKDIAKRNSIEFYVPVTKAMNLGGDDVLYTDQMTGETKRVPNQLRKMLNEMVNASTDEKQISWVTRNGFNLNKEVTLPIDQFGSVIDSGKIYANSSDQIILSFVDDGNQIEKNITGLTGLNYSTYKNNPTRYDDLIQNWTEQYFIGLEKQLIKNSQIDVNDHKVKSVSSNTGGIGDNGQYINWSKVSYRFGFN